MGIRITIHNFDVTTQEAILIPTRRDLHGPYSTISAPPHLYVGHVEEFVANVKMDRYELICFFLTFCSGYFLDCMLLHTTFSTIKM